MNQAEIEQMRAEVAPALSAAELVKRAESSTDPGLLYLAGQILDSGYQVEPDAAKARQFFQKAAESGHVEAVVRVAGDRVEADDTPENRRKALEMVQPWAEKGHPVAQFALAKMQAQGFAGEKSVPVGLEKIRQMAKDGVPLAENALGSLYLEGILVEKNPDEAFKWFFRAAESGLPDALLNLGVCYAHGIGVEVSPENAFSWNLRAAEQGVTEAEHNVGNAFLNGRGVARNLEMARFWFLKSARKGRSESMAVIGLLDLGLGINEASVKSAVPWLEKASALNNPLGRFVLAGLYVSSESPIYEMKKGVELLKLSADQGFPPSQAALVELLRFGHIDGVPSDRVEAAKWGILAVKGGMAAAEPMLASIRNTLSETDWNEAQARAASFKPKAGATDDGLKFLYPAAK